MEGGRTASWWSKCTFKETMINLWIAEALSLSANHLNFTSCRANFAWDVPLVGSCLWETRRGRRGMGNLGKCSESTRRSPQRNDGRLMHEGVGGINATLRVEQNYRLRGDPPETCIFMHPTGLSRASAGYVCMCVCLYRRSLIFRCFINAKPSPVPRRFSRTYVHRLLPKKGSAYNSYAVPQTSRYYVQNSHL